MFKGIGNATSQVDFLWHQKHSGRGNTTPKADFLSPVCPGAPHKCSPALSSPAGFCWQAGTNQTFCARPSAPAASRLYSSSFMAGNLGGSITHQCFYPATPANKHGRKYWCKIAADGLCYTIISSSFAASEYQGRVMSSSQPGLGSSTVVLGQLREEDAGWYWCGASSGHTELTASLNRYLPRERIGCGRDKENCPINRRQLP
uniref:Immunoglobulin V-set domain-containing protein n=1 Tax=Taeniopygia guttata TaxID=59729 RepID=A0A674GSD1_TAEGU